MRLALSTNNQLAQAFFFGAETTALASGYVVSLDADGLVPNTDYYYGIEVDGVLRTEQISRGHFRTFPKGAGSFKIAFASCGDFRDSDQRAYDAIRAEQPLIFVHMGDFHYSDTSTVNPDDYRRNYDEVLSHPNQGALYRSVPIAYIWDDHDFSGDNSNGAALGGAVARSTYREYVPHYPLNATGGTIAQAFTIGRVRLIMTDLHSAAMSASAPESATKTRMGAAQKAWFKQELLVARDAGFPLILWVSADPWIGRASVGADSWGGHATERTEIATFLKENLIKNVVILAGDMHSLAFDDGTHSDYSIGGGAPIIVLQAGSLTREGSVKGGPYTAGPFPGSPQYGLFEVIDTGGPTVQCRFTGKRVGEGIKLAFQFTASAAAVDADVPPDVSSASLDRALINISARGRIASPDESIIAGFVIAGRTPRRMLMRAVGPSLAAFGVTNAAPRPTITLRKGDTVVGSNEDWGLDDVTRLTDAFDRVGAFRLTSSASRDAALLLTLDPGAYTLQAGSSGGTVGSLLVEIYEVP